MTTIILKDNCLVADRRMLVNAGNANVIVGVRDEAKIYKLPYCLYGLSGFEFEIDKDSSMKKMFDNVVATLCALTYICEENKEKDAMIRNGTGWTKSQLTLVQYRASLMVTLIGEYFAQSLFKTGKHLVIVTKYKTLLFENSKFDTYDTNETIVLGSGKKMTHLLLDKGTPFEEIYHVLRSTGVPTGTKLDKFHLNELPDFFPPIDNVNFYSTIDFYHSTTIKKEFKEGLIPKLTYDRSKCTVVEIIATFISMGKVKNGRYHFYKDAISNWDQASLKNKHIKLLESVCKIMQIPFDEYLNIKKDMDHAHSV